MKALPLLACLALLAPHARADDPAAAAPTQPAPSFPGRDAALAEIDAWRHGQLVHMTPPDPLTAEFEPDFKLIAARVDAAQSDAQLAQPLKDFQAWQHDFLLKKYGLTRNQGTTHGSLDTYSQNERERMRLLAAQTAQISRARLTQTPAQTFDGSGANSAGAVGAGPGGGVRTAASTINNPAATPGLRINPTPLPPPSAKPLTLASLRDYFDRSGISDAVIRSMETIKNAVTGFGHLLTGFAGSCYYGVKWMLIKTHVLPPEVALPEEIGRIGIGSGSAYEMNRALKHNPKLQAKLHVRPLDLTTVSDADASLIPERTMLVFDRGCAGFSADSGHIEYTLLPDKISELPASVFRRVGRRPVSKPTVAADQVLACSDGCMIHPMWFLRKYAARGCLNAYVPVTDYAAAPSSQPPPAAEIPAAGG